MGNGASKSTPKSKAENINNSVMESSSGFHLFEVHAPTLGAGILIILGIFILIILCKRYLRYHKKQMLRYPQSASWNHMAPENVVLHGLPPTRLSAVPDYLTSQRPKMGMGPTVGPIMGQTVDLDDLYRHLERALTFHAGDRHPLPAPRRDNRIRDAEDNEDEADPIPPRRTGARR